MKLSQTQKEDFMKKTAFIADKSTCGYKIGCVGVVEDIGQNILNVAKEDPEFRRKDGLIYLKTWNETLPGEIYCRTCDITTQKRNCVRVQENLKGRDLQKVCSIHAEVNLISKCARYGISTEGMALFVTNSPCYICAKSIIHAGISEVYYMAEHTDRSGLEILGNSGVMLCKTTLDLN